MIDVDGLAKRYAGIAALRDVSLRISAGERHAIIGPNGAGKSTLLRIVGGCLRPTSGRVQVLGQDVTGWSPDRVCRLGVARTAQRSTLFPEETLLDSCLLAAAGGSQVAHPWRRLGGDPELVAAAREALESVGLAHRAGDRASELSHGEARQSEIAMALAQRPRVLLADEPLAGLADAERQTIARLLHDLGRQMTVLFVEHDLAFAMEIGEVVTVLDLGRVVITGPPAVVRSSEEVQRLYIGQAPVGPSNLPAVRAVRASPEPALSIGGLSAGYGAARVVHEVSLEVAEGRVLTVLGRNGMGKTTLLGALMGTVDAGAGIVLLGGLDLTGLSTTARARAGLALVPQGRGILSGLDVEEQLTVGQRPGPWTVESVYAMFPFLRERRRQEATTLSGGEQGMLAIARGLLRNPRVLLMDEPSEGLAPRVLEQLRGVINGMAERGQTIVLAEQNVGLALSVADEVVVMERGRIVHRGSADALRADATLQRAVMGI